LKNNGYYANDEEITILMEKLDKDRDGRVSYNEFMEEFTPKSPTKAF